MVVLIKGIIGGLLTVLLHYAAKSESQSFLAGLIPLFPTFALIAHFQFVSDNAPERLQEAAQFGMLALVPYGLYLFVVWGLSLKMPMILSIIIALLSWGVAAAAMYLIWIHQRA